MSSSLKYYCDKCGAELPTEYIQKRGMIGNTIELNNDKKFIIPMDFCRDCAKELTEVMNTYLNLGRSYPNHNINVTVIVGKGGNKE